MDYSLLGNRIRNCRKSKGMSQARLAELLDVSVNYIGQIELAERHIGLDLLENISIVLDISILSLLYEVNTGTLIAEEINLIHSSSPWAKLRTSVYSISAKVHKHRASCYQ